MNEEKIIICGDVHGDFKSLESMIKEQKPSMVIQLGDFGYWPRFDITKPNIPDTTKVWWIDGNHEDFVALKGLIFDKNGVWAKNTQYMKRSEIKTLPNGMTALFLGGAWSIDNPMRVDGRDWFSEDEILKESDINPLLENFMQDDIPEIDVVFSHTAPHEFEMGFDGEHENDFSRKVLSYVLNTFRPKLWYCGHWHIHKEGEHIFHDNTSCKWEVLDHTKGYAKWWTGLQNKNN